MRVHWQAPRVQLLPHVTRAIDSFVTKKRQLSVMTALEMVAKFTVTKPFNEFKIMCLQCRLFLRSCFVSVFRSRTFLSCVFRAPTNWPTHHAMGSSGAIVRNVHFMHSAWPNKLITSLQFTRRRNVARDTAMVLITISHPTDRLNFGPLHVDLIFLETSVLFCVLKNYRL